MNNHAVKCAFAVLCFCTAAAAYAASSHAEQGRNKQTQSSDLLFFEYLGVMVQDEEGWVDPLQMEDPNFDEKEMNDVKTAKVETEDQTEDHTEDASLRWVASEEDLR